MEENMPGANAPLSVEERFAEEALTTVASARDVLERVIAGVGGSAALDEIARAIFSLNGAAEVLDLEQIKLLTARFCKAVTSVRDREEGSTESALHTLAGALDTLADLFHRLRTGDTAVQPLAPLFEELDALAGPTTPRVASSTRPAKPAGEPPARSAANVAPQPAEPASVPFFEDPVHPEPDAEPASEELLVRAAEATADPDEAPREAVADAVVESPPVDPAEAPVEPATAHTAEFLAEPQPEPELVPEPAEEASTTAMPSQRVSYTPSASMLAEANNQMHLPDMQLVIDAFVEDAAPSIEEIKQDLLALTGSPEDAHTLDDVLKTMGNLRSTAGFLSLEQLSLLCRKLEHTAHQLISGGLEWTPSVGDTLHSAMDVLQSLIQQVADRKIAAVEMDGLLSALDTWIPEGSKPPALEVVEVPAAVPAPKAAPTAPPQEPAVDEHEGELPDVMVDPSHQIYSEDFREIVESFVVEASEILENLDNKLLRLETDYQDRALVDEIFRDVHTVKGSAGFLNLQQLSHVAHHFEDVLNRLRRGDIVFHPSMMDVMFAAYDQMKVLALQVKNLKLEVVRQGPIIRQLTAISSGTFQPEKATGLRREADDLQEQQATEEVEAHEESAGRTDGVARPESPERAASNGGGGGGTNRALDKSIETIRVEVHRLDNLMNLVGELVLNRNRLVQITEDLNTALSDDLQRALLETSAQLDFITTELQTGVMHTRMVQIGRIFNKYPRVVRDLARSTDKEIELVIEGAETELDKSLTEEIGDPLVHLLRNSVDHGVEVPEKRVAAGKPAVGTIRLVARQEGNNIIIEVSDDGAGINVERVKRKAVEKNLITEAEAAEMTDNDAFNLIFKPGFSTAEKISNISGRGVGMDVVRTHIARLNGTISIQSQPGKGSTVTLKLPLTLAIKQSLLVRQSRETFAIPLHSVIEVVGMENHRIESINGREVLRLRERILPLVYVSDILGLERQAESRPAYAVVVGLAHHRVGLITEDLVGQKEIVIKPLGNYLKKIPGIAGSTILGDGRVIMILDVAELIRIEQEKPRRRPSSMLEPVEA